MHPNGRKMLRGFQCWAKGVKKFLYNLCDFLFINLSLIILIDLIKLIKSDSDNLGLETVQYTAKIFPETYPNRDQKHKKKNRP